MFTGPRSATPTTPTVLVLTPSIGFEPVSISSTYTPGARYSGMWIFRRLSQGQHSTKFVGLE